MNFDPTAYGPRVAEILALDGDGGRLMPLASGACSSPEALSKIETAGAARLFPNSRAPEAALSGLYLYFSCRDQAHEVAQSVDSAEGAFWHGIVHRQEPDASNARYWFRQVGSHSIFPALAAAAADTSGRVPSAGISLNGRWDPVQFVDICERACQQPGSPLTQLALEIQRAEWQLLFDSCAREGSSAL
jgi:hypothetical protein